MGIHKQYFFLSFCLWSFCAHSAEVTLANGDRYEGEFLNDQPDGSGTYRWVDGRIYTGEFQSGVRQGRGQLQWPNGDL